MSGGAFAFPPPPPPPPPTSFSAPARQTNGGFQCDSIANGSSNRTRDLRGNHHDGGRGLNSSNPQRGGRQQPRGCQTQGPSKNAYNQGLRPHESWRGTSDARSRADFGGQFKSVHGARGRGSKQPRNIGVAPAVPSFGGPLPHIPSAFASKSHTDDQPANKKQKRNHNQLGLTPSNETHEDSDEDAVDDEARLAAAHRVADTGIEFTYRGQSSSLKTPAEIAAWIAERKKRYPTRARVEQAEKRRQELQELRQAALRAQNEAKEKRQAERQAETSMAANVISREAEARSRPVSKALKQPLKQQDAVSKTRRKIEKLEKRLEQEKIKIQQASAKATTMPTPEIYQNTRGQSVPTQVIGNSDCEALEFASSSISSDVSSPLGYDSDDSTSSSQSSSSDESPESQPVSLQGPQKVPPPKRQPANTPVCRNIARFGRCKRLGCRFRHEKPEKRHPVKDNNGTMSLYQKLVQKEKEEEDKTVLAAIIYLGQQGRLGEPGTTPEAAEC